MENRKFRRITFVSRATVVFDDQSFETVTGNLSLDGLFVRTERQIVPGQPAEITFDLPSASRSSSITVNGIVVRNDSHGLAFQFRSLDHDSFSHLRTVIDRKSPHSLKPYFHA